MTHLFRITNAIFFITVASFVRDEKKHFGVFLVHSNVHLLMTECMVEYVLSYLIAELPFKSFCFCLLEYYITFRY